MMIAGLVAVGAGAWVFSKVVRRSGGNMQTTLISAGFCGLIVFVVAWTLLNTLFQ